MSNTDKKENFRIFVGSISNELVNDIQDLESRLGKLGKVVKPIEIHQKTLVDNNFAFITMNLTKLEFKKLRKMFNGVNFKGSKLIIDLARPDYKELWKKDSKRQDDHILHRKQRERIAACRLERIANAHANPFKLSLISKGRIRKTKRKGDLKNLTIRILMNGRLKTIKCKKTKLWGMNKNKSIRDLTSRFIAGEWRDGNDHVLDRLTKKVLVFEDDGVKVKDIAELDDSGEKYEEFNEEQQRTNKLLEDLLGKYDFDKPINFQEIENEEKAGSDYEVAGALDRDDDDGDEMEIVYNVPQKECVQPSQKSIVEDYISQHQDLIPRRNDYMDVKDGILVDDDDDDDFFKNLSTTVSTDKTTEGKVANNEKMTSLKKDYFDNRGNETEGKFYGREEEQEKAEEEKEKDKQVEKADRDADDDDYDDEFIPTFGGSDNTSNYNTTDALRSLLNPDRQDDADDEEAPQEDNIQNFEMAVPVTQKKNVGLFFAHFESPFLIAQTQINKVREIKVNEELDYDAWFWENRGELNREFRRRRRDVLRRAKKKTKNTALI